MPKTKTELCVSRGKPTHTHTDPSTDPPTSWECSSPYCNELERVSPDNGGPMPRGVPGNPE